MTNKQMPEDNGARSEKGRKGLPILSVFLSVVSAISLWLYVISIEDPTYTKTFDGIVIQFKNENVMIEEGLEVISGRGKAVSVTVRGRRRDINRYTADDITAFVDASNVNVPKTYNLAVQTEAPDGLTVTATDIKSIEVYADIKDSVDVKIDPVISINCEASGSDSVSGGKIVSDNYVSSEDLTINISGPMSKLNKIKGARVRPITLDIIKLEDYNQISGQLEFYDASGAAVQSEYIKVPGDGIVSISVPVMRTETFDISVAFEDDTDLDKYEVSYTPSEIQVIGERAVIKTLTNENFSYVLEGSAKDNLGVKKHVFDLPEKIGQTVGAKDQESLVQVELTVKVTKKPETKTEENPAENKD